MKSFISLSGIRGFLSCYKDFKHQQVGGSYFWNTEETEMLLPQYKKSLTLKVT